MTFPATLDDLARDAYLGSTFRDGPWERLPPANRARWAAVVSVVADRAAAGPWSFDDLDPLDRRILDRAVAGVSVARIAAEVGRTSNRVQHRLAETAFAAGVGSRAVLLRRYAEWRDTDERAAAA